MIRSPDAVSVDVIGALERAKIPCAIGGAIAFGFRGGARGTTDADINAFVGGERHEELLSVLFAAGCTGDRAKALEQARDGATIDVRRWIVDMLGADSDRVAEWDKIVATHGPK